MPAYDVPTTLSPSRVDSFLSCPLAFRFRSLDGLPDPPTLATLRGTMVHRALEIFHSDPDTPRDRAQLSESVNTMVVEFREHPDVAFLGLDKSSYDDLASQCQKLAAGVFEMEDPSSISPVGLELRVEAEVGPVVLRGIIDRLERSEDGSLIVTDYKTGRAPGPGYERKALGGVHLYSLLCELTMGERPSAVRLMYVSSKETITDTPTEQSNRFMAQRVTAVHGAIEQSCRTGEFRTKKSALCKFCAFRSWCPEFGGDPQRAVVEGPEQLSRRAI